MDYGSISNPYIDFYGQPEHGPTIRNVGRVAHIALQEKPWKLKPDYPPKPELQMKRAKLAEIILSPSLTKIADVQDPPFM